MALIVSVAGRGLIRETMEDFVYPPAGGVYRVSDYPFLAMVADGVAGAPDGEVASELAVESFVSEFNRLVAELGERALDANVLTLLFDRVNRHLLSANPKMATTLTVGVFTLNEVFVLWSGDSPAYMYRSGRLKRLTEPHIVGAWVTDSDGNPVLSTVLYSCLGGGEADFDVGVTVIPFKEGDVFLFASDGVPLHLEELEIAELLARNSLEGAIQKMEEMILQRGAYDNFSIVGVRLP